MTIELRCPKCPGMIRLERYRLGPRYNDLWVLRCPECRYQEPIPLDKIKRDRGDPTLPLEWQDG